MKIAPLKITFDSFCEELTEQITIHNHSLTFVTGDSGSGKTLFLSHVAEQSDFKNKVYYQHTNACPPTNYKVKEVLSLLTIPQGDYEAFLEYISKFFDIRKHIDSHLKDLSGGERAFISLISSLFSKKDIIMLDEPLNMVSVENRDKGAQLIKEVSQYKTVFVISHFKELFNPLADQIITIKDHKIALTKDSKQDGNEKVTELKTCKKTGTKIWRYVKDDMPLLFVILLIVFSCQFLTMFIASGIENEKVQAELSNTLYFEASSGISADKGYLPDPGLIKGDEIPGIVEMDYPAINSFERPILSNYNGVINYGYYRQFSTLTGDELFGKNETEMSQYVRNFDIPSFSIRTDSYRGKTGELAQDEVILGTQALNLFSKIDLSTYDFTSPILISYVDNTKRAEILEEKISSQGIPSNMIEQFTKNESYFTSDSEITSVKVVGYDSGVDAFAYRTNPETITDFITYISLPSDKYEDETLFFNTGYPTLSEAVSAANKALMQKGDFTHTYRADTGNLLIQNVQAVPYFQYSDFQELIENDDSICSFAFGALSYSPTYESINYQKYYFMNNVDLFLEDAINTLDREFNPETDVLVGHRDYNAGDIVNLFGKDYTVYGEAYTKIYSGEHHIEVLGDVDFLLSKSQYNSVFKTMPKLMSDYGSGLLADFDVFYHNPLLLTLKRQMIENTFKDTNPNGTYTKYLNERQSREVENIFLSTKNSKKNTRTLSVSIAIISGIAIIALSSVTVYLLKQNYRYNRFKKDVSRRNYLAPSIISVFILLLTLSSLLLKNIAYHLTVYDLPRIMNFTSLSYETGTFMSNVTTILTFGIAVLFSIYLYIRNLDVFEKRSKK